MKTFNLLGLFAVIAGIFVATASVYIGYLMRKRGKVFGLAAILREWRAAETDFQNDWKPLRPLIVIVGGTPVPWGLHVCKSKKGLRLKYRKSLWPIAGSGEAVIPWHQIAVAGRCLGIPMSLQLKVRIPDKDVGITLWPIPFKNSIPDPGAETVSDRPIRK